MRHELESLMLALAIGSSVVIGAKRVGVPYNVALVVVGLLAVLIDALPEATLDPELVLLLFLPMLVFEAALFADAEQLSHAKLPIVALAAPGVALALLATAAIATYVLALPFPIALLMGALLAITDTVSVLLAFRSTRVPQRLAAIMEGESLFNDGTALVLVGVCTTAALTGSFDAAASIRDLVIAIVGGGALGAAFGAIGAAVLRRAPDHLTALLASVVLVFSTSLLAERLHASPVIAVVVAGLWIGRAARVALDPSRVLALHGFWEVCGFAVNVFLFLLVGMQIDAARLWAEAGSIGLALVALHVGRALAVYGSFALLRTAWKERVPASWQHVMVFGNIKGALSMAAVLALPLEVPYRDRLVTIVFGVTFITLVTQGLPFKQIIRRLGVTLTATDVPFDRAKAALIAAKRGQTELDGLLEAGMISRKEHAERRATFQRGVIAAETTLRSPRGEIATEELVEVTLLVGQKAALFEAARRGVLDAEVASSEIGDIDRKLADIREKGSHS